MTRNIQYKKLGEICDFISGGTPSKSKNEYWKNGNIPWIKISDFKEKYIKFSEEKITKIGLENSSAKILKKGTILYTIFASVGKVAILDIEATTNQAIVGINLKEDNSIDKDFLYYFLSSIENNIKKQARGVAQNNINISILKNINTPILPMSFQKNIVKTLNKLENILENFKQKKLLINSLNKSLFTRMFGDIKTNDKNWEIIKLEKYINIIGGYAFKNTDFKSKGIPLIRIGNINSGHFKNTNLVFIEENQKLEKFKVFPNDIIISLTGTVGKDDYGNVCILGDSYSEYYLNQRNAKLVLTDKIDKNFFLEIIKIKEVKKQLTGVSRGIRQANISNRDIYNLSFPLPPIELQNKFAKRIEKIEKLSFEIEEAIKEAENLYNSLISKYFD